MRQKVEIIIPLFWELRPYGRKSAICKPIIHYFKILMINWKFLKLHSETTYPENSHPTTPKEIQYQSNFQQILM